MTHVIERMHDPHVADRDLHLDTIIQDMIDQGTLSTQKESVRSPIMLGYNDKISYAYERKTTNPTFDESGLFITVKVIYTLERYEKGSPTGTRLTITHIKQKLRPHSMQHQSISWTDIEEDTWQRHEVYPYFEGKHTKVFDYIFSKIKPLLVRPENMPE